MKRRNGTRHEQKSSLLCCTWRQWVPPKRSYLPTELHGATFLKTAKFIIMTVRTSNCTVRDVVLDVVLHTQTKKQAHGRQYTCTFNVTLLRIPVTTVAMETQKCLLFVFLRTYGDVNNVLNIAAEEQQCLLYIAALHTSLPTTWHTLRSSRKVPDISVRF
jgi:hypothetical protein